MPALDISIDDPSAVDVQELLDAHLTFSAADISFEDDHALGIDELQDSSVIFVGARRHGKLLAIGALRELDHGHGELKSMHTAQAARGQGIGSAVLAYLIEIARDRDLRRLSLETGTQPWFAAARALYGKAGFIETGAFGDYRESPNSIYMTLDLTRRSQGSP